MEKEREEKNPSPDEIRAHDLDGFQMKKFRFQEHQKIFLFQAAYHDQGIGICISIGIGIENN